jgi:hypothetical protein
MARTSLMLVGHSTDSRRLAQCREPVYGTLSNACGAPRPRAGATEEQKLLAVGSGALLRPIRMLLWYGE